MSIGPIITCGGMDSEDIFWNNIKQVFIKVGTPLRLVVLIAIAKSDEEFVYKQLVPKRTKDWEKLGINDVKYFIVNETDTSEDGKLIKLIEWADAIAIMGGDTREYHKHFCKDLISSAIREANFVDGKPVIGVSAGTLIMPKHCIIWGSEFCDSKQNIYSVQSEYLKDQWNDGDLLFRTGKGIGLFEDLILDVHCTQYGRIPRLIKALSDNNQITKGIGLDANSCVLMTSDKQFISFGKGFITIIEKNKEPYTDNEFLLLNGNISVLCTGSTFSFESRLS